MEQTRAKEIEIKKIINVFRKRLWIVILITIITTSASAIYSTLNKQIPLYKTSASLAINDNKGFINTLTVFVKEPLVLETVKTKLDINRSIESISSQIAVESVQDSQIVKISVVDANPELSAEIANTTAEVLISQVASTFNYKNIDIISSAAVKDNIQPINPPSNRLIKIGLALGIIFGIGFILLLDSLDNKIRSERDLERLLELPVLGTISKHNFKAISNIKNKKKSNNQIRGELIESSIPKKKFTNVI